MSRRPLAVRCSGLVTPVGLDAPAACAAMRAKLTNPTPTRFTASEGDWLVAHQVALEKPWRGREKLARMAERAAREALAPVPEKEWASIPMLLCVAEQSRPGRIEGLDDQLFLDLQERLGVGFGAHSAIVRDGRVGVAVALSQARTLLYEQQSTYVLIVATDSLVSGPTLNAFRRAGRLLTARNSNGFIAGEGAGALLVSRPGRPGELVCTGIGFGVEKAHIDSEEPLRAAGLEQAIKAALAEAQMQMHDLDFRITDLSGEHYYFKEAALAFTRTLRKRKEEFDLWHPAECTGEAGAAAGVNVIALADAACRKGFTKGPAILAHFSADAGQRAALTLQFQGNP